MNDEVRAELAQLLGMKPREVVHADLADGQIRITTHDGQAVMLPAPAMPPDSGIERAPEPDPADAPPVTVPDEEAPPSPVEVDPIEPEPLEVPDGSAKDIRAWVDGDPARAAAALAAERARPTPRTTLIAELERLAQE